jgi:hypothetical protein
MCLHGVDMEVKNKWSYNYTPPCAFMELTWRLRISGVIIILPHVPSWS